MALSRSDQMVERLRNMQAAAPDIEASAVVSVDGLIMASALQQGVEEDRVSAMSAAMLSLGERISGELNALVSRFRCCSASASVFQASLGAAGWSRFTSKAIRARSC